MANCDFKISKIVRDGKRTVCNVKIYKGVVSAQKETTREGKVVEVTRYRRTELCSSETMEFEGDLSDGEIENECMATLKEFSEKENVEPIPVQKNDA